MVSKQLQLGRAGHFFQQVTDDFGAPFVLDGFRSRIAGIGLQIGFPVSGRGHGYKEFAAQNRPDGGIPGGPFAARPRNWIGRREIDVSHMTGA